MRIRRIRVKQGQMANLFRTRKIQNIVKNMFQNKIKQIKKNTNLLQNAFTHKKKTLYTCKKKKKRKRLFEKRLKKITKMQNLLQNENASLITG